MSLRAWLRRELTASVDLVAVSPTRLPLSPDPDEAKRLEAKWEPARQWLRKHGKPLVE